MIPPVRYNIRAYGICLDGKGHVLLTDELRNGMHMTKFPGGGHHLGEGIEDTLRREFREETNTEIEIHGLFYLNEFLQISAFNPQEQLLSIYYLVSLAEALGVALATSPFEFQGDSGDLQAFRWMKIADLDSSDFIFPIDKVVVEKLKTNQSTLCGLVRDSHLRAE